MNLARDLPLALVTVASVAFAVACARAWMARTVDLQLSLFRPYRGDPWPVGVQEDDDVHFVWTAVPAPTVEAVDAGSLEDVATGPTAERVDRVRVHRLDH